MSLVLYFPACTDVVTYRREWHCVA